jgi:hypothetical protein
MKKFYAYLLFSVLSVILLTFTACDGGSSSDSSLVESSKTALTLSTKQAVPGTYISIKNSSIKDGDNLEVRFKNDLGFDVTLKTTLTKEGDARVSVPIVVDTSTGKSITSTLSVSIEGSNEAYLEVSSLPDVNAKTGDVVKMYLSYLKERLQNAYSQIETSSTLSSDNAKELKKNILLQTESIDKSLNELNDSSSISFFSSDIGKFTLTGSDLKELDKMLYAVLNGIVNEINPSVRSLNTREDDLLVQLKEKLSEISKTIKNGEIVLIGATGAIVTVSALIFGTEAAVSTAFATLAGGASIIVIGSALETVTLLESLANGEPYIFGEAIKSESIDAIVNIGTALGGDHNSILNLIGFLYSGYSSAVAGSSIVCSQNPIPEAFQKYCLDRKESANNDFKVASVRFYTDTFIRNEEKLSNKLGDHTWSFMPPGNEGELSFIVLGSKTRITDIIIDWGDNQKTDMQILSGHFQTGIKHVYNLRSDQSESYYTITIKATDGFSNETSNIFHVVVKDSYKKNITFSSVPKRVLTNQSYTWGVTVEGAVDDYIYTLDWGDGTQNSSSIYTAGEILLTHTYTNAGFFTVKMDIYQRYFSDKITTQTYKIEVRNPVSIVDIAGPKELDLDERGDWSVTLRGGWEPYFVSLDWGDGSSPIENSTSNKTFGFHKSYKEKGTYTMTLRVIGEGGSEDTKSIILQVPREPETFPITTTLYCQNDNGKVVTFKGSGVGTLTDKTDLLFEFDGDDTTLTATLIDKHFSLVKTVVFDEKTTVRLTMDGSINIDDFTDEITGSGTITESIIDNNGDVSTCTGTWKSE